MTYEKDIQMTLNKKQLDESRKIWKPQNAKHWSDFLTDEQIAKHEQNTTFTVFWAVIDFACGMRGSFRLKDRVPGWPVVDSLIYVRPINGIIWDVKYSAADDQFQVWIGSTENEESVPGVRMDSDFNPDRFLMGMYKDGWDCVELYHPNYAEAIRASAAIPGSKAKRWEDRRE